MSVTIVQVDAFTDKKFGGNPAGVCLLTESRDDDWMQQVAAEMNLSETAFVLKDGDDYSLRWFTPVVEVDLCGHATLASAHAMWEHRWLRPDEQARFHTRSGVLTAERKEDWIEMDFPAEPVKQTGFPPELAKSIGASMLFVGMNRLDYLVELDSERTVKLVKPNLALLAALQSRGVIVTARATDPRCDFVSRYFAPRCGIDEDPVTGSAHCALGPYWQQKLNKDELVGYQTSARGGVVRVKVLGERVKLGGQAVTVMRGQLV